MFARSPNRDQPDSSPSKERTLLRVFVVVAATVPAFGCVALWHPTAERLVRVQGRIEGISTGTQCVLRLIEAANHRARGQRSVSSEFATGFVVAPGRRRAYYTEITCGAETVRSRIYSLSDAPWTIDLATITLTGKEK